MKILYDIVYCVTSLSSFLKYFSFFEAVENCFSFFKAIENSTFPWESPLKMNIFFFVVSRSDFHVDYWLGPALYQRMDGQESEL